MGWPGIPSYTGLRPDRLARADLPLPRLVLGENELLVEVAHVGQGDVLDRQLEPDQLLDEQLGVSCALGAAAVHLAAVADEACHPLAIRIEQLGVVTADDDLVKTSVFAQLKIVPSIDVQRVGVHRHGVTRRDIATTQFVEGPMGRIIELPVRLVQQLVSVIARRPKRLEEAELAPDLLDPALAGIPAERGGDGVNLLSDPNEPSSLLLYGVGHVRSFMLEAYAKWTE